LARGWIKGAALAEHDMVIEGLEELSLERIDLEFF